MRYFNIRLEAPGYKDTAPIVAKKLTNLFFISATYLGKKFLGILPVMPCRGGLYVRLY